MKYKITLLLAILLYSNSSFASYDRGSWSHWKKSNVKVDIRQELLIRNGKNVVVELKGNILRAKSGEWVGSYSNEILTMPKNIHIDHVVSLKEAYLSRTMDWSRTRKKEFANDKGNLMITFSKENIKKSAKNISYYIPVHGTCEFIKRYKNIKNKYFLSYTEVERIVLERELKKCYKNGTNN